MTTMKIKQGKCCMNACFEICSYPEKLNIQILCGWRKSQVFGAGGDYTLLSPYLLNFNLMTDHTLLGTLCWYASCNSIIFFHSKIKGK